MRPLHKSRHNRNDVGALSIWVVLTAATAFLAIVGLVADGGRILNTRASLDRAAAQAARAGADQLSAAGIRDGNNDVSASQAVTAAQKYLAAAGIQGTATVNGQTVTVTVHQAVQPQILGTFGMPTINVTETESAQGIQGGP